MSYDKHDDSGDELDWYDAAVERVAAEDEDSEDES